MKSVTIIGGGFAGLSAAVFLDAGGFRVTLLEKKPVLGGRAYAFLDRKTGHWVDNGQHLLIGAYHETLKFIENIGATRHLKPQIKMDVPIVADNGHLFHFSPASLPSPLNMLVGLFKIPGLKIRDKINLLGLGMDLKKIKKNGNIFSDDLSVAEWLEKKGQSARARRNFWDPLTYAVLNDDPALACAKILRVVLAKAFLGKASDGCLILPKSNLNEILAGPAKAFLELRGQSLKLSDGVKILRVMDNKVCGVELESGELVKSDYYISSVPFSALLRMIPESFVQSLPYFSRIKNLQSSPIVSINLWFDRDILPHDFVGMADRQIHWVFNKNRIYGTDTPPYHYMGVVSGAYKFIDLNREEILKIALGELSAIFPVVKKAVLVHSLVNKEREATLSPRIGSEDFRPSQKSPFENFFVAGDWTDTGLPATIESAVLSARLAVEAICQTRLQ